MTMDPGTAFVVQQAMRRYADDCRAAQAKLPRALTLREVKQVADVQPQSIIAQVRHAIPERRQLKAAAERRAEEICKGHMAKLQDLVDQKDSEGFREAVSRHWRNDWILLRGGFPRLVHLVDRESRRLAHVLETALGEQSPPQERPRGEGERG
jgi:hypothetical protein